MQTNAEDEATVAEDYRDQASAAATDATTAATSAKGFADAAEASGDAVIASYSDAFISDTAAGDAKDAAEDAVANASNHAAVALYNSWGTIEDHDYDFLTYGIWGEYQVWKHNDDLVILNHIDAEMQDTDELLYQGVKYTAADNSA